MVWYLPGVQAVAVMHRLAPTKLEYSELPLHSLHDFFFSSSW
jgi:hypothetical protein